MNRSPARGLRLLSLLAVPFLLGSAGLRADAPKVAPNLLQDGPFANTRPTYEVWGGVDSSGALRTPCQYAPIVDRSGALQKTPFPPSIAAADFSGKGLIDLVVADSDGRLWFYPNSGTKEAPVFVGGTPLPFFIGSYPPSVQAVDIDGDGKPDIVFGDGLGRLFMFRNVGSPGSPRFDSNGKSDQLQIRTRHDNKPWCNFLSPAYAIWGNGTVRDLIAGDGTYASDNIYFLRNKGTNDRPQFDDPVILIPGNGREQLVVQPWPRNPKGPPDLIVADREGHFTLYPNQSVDGDPVPKFGLPTSLKLGSSDSFGNLPRFAVADLNGDGKPDLIIGSPNGTLRVAYNTGTAEEPKFDHADALKGTNIGKATAAPVYWTFASPWWNWGIPPGAFFYNVHLVGSDPKEPSTYEEGLILPDGAKRAMKYESNEPPPGSGTFPPPVTDENGKEMTYNLWYANGGADAAGVPLNDKTAYEFRFQLKGDMENLTVTLVAGYRTSEKKGTVEVFDEKTIRVNRDLQPSSSWQEIKIPYPVEMEKGTTQQTLNLNIFFQANGKGNYYIANPTLRQVSK